MRKDWNARCTRHAVAPLLIILLWGCGDGAPFGGKYRAARKAPPKAYPKAKGHAPAVPGVDPVEEYLRSLREGTYAFNAPSRMERTETVSVQLRLGPMRKTGEVASGITEPGEVYSGTALIAPTMKAELRGSDFVITALTSERRTVATSSVTEWRWEIKARRSGTLSLTLALYVIRPGTEDLLLATAKRTIEVYVPPGKAIQGFVQKNWQWLWTAIFIPIGAWLVKRFRKQRRKPS